MSIVIGVDPDSSKYGIAIYIDGKLDDLLMMPLPEIIYDLLKAERYNYAKWSVENVAGQSYQYARNKKQSAGANMAQMRNVGMCQQAQTELVRVLEFNNRDVVLHKPQRGNWAKNKAQFEKVTGWTRRSNEDTRSAAYFGWLALK